HVGLLAALLLASGCDDTVVVPAGWIAPECAASAWVEVVPLDIWGRELVEPSVSGPTAPYRLESGGEPQWSVAGSDLLGSTVTVRWNGGGDVDSVSASATDGARIAVSLRAADIDGTSCRLYSVFLGLDHAYYAASGPAPKAGNDVEFLMDGEEQWARFQQDLQDPDRTAVRVHQTTWWWESDHELIRDDGATTPSLATRTANTVMTALEARGGVHRVIVARFAAETAPGLAYQNTDPALRGHANDPTDGFEVIQQANATEVEVPGHYRVEPRPFSFVARVRANSAYADRMFGLATETIEAPLVAIEAASYHQKAAVFDADLAYVSGMNVKGNDWDGSEHLVFDVRRMHFDATEADRQAVRDKLRLPDNPTRKDYGVRMVGPIARDVDAVLKQRWDFSIANGELYSEHATTYDLLEPAPPAGDVTVQIVTTSPEPLASRSILETHEKASRRATDLIFVEDQYWRAPILHDALFEAMDKNPALHLVVITQPIADTNGAKKYSHLADEAFRSRYPNRYLLLQLIAFDRDANNLPRFEPVFLHSKLHIVDDHYLSLGSCNKNNRGYVYEGEMNVAIVDTPFVSAAKERVLRNLVGVARAAEVVGQSGAVITAALREMAESNAAVEAALLADPTAELQPVGFVYPLEFTSKYVLDVGPDLF
ncbi:MAG: hypothetical protein ACI9OJ_003978, partial [Myxococcota bacterium]